MEIKDMRIFEAVAAHGSVSKAAKELNYVQSHVSARINYLETSLQTCLFHRYSRGMILNSEGKKLLNYTKNIVSSIDEMIKVVQDSNNPSGSLEIGTVETVIKLPNVLSVFLNKYPNVDLSLVSGVTNQLVNDILNYKLDGAFVTGFAPIPSVIQYEVFQEDLVLISNKIINFDTFDREPLLVFNSGCSYREKLMNWLTDQGFTSPKIMEFGTLETILGGVISGLGVSLVPKSSVSHLEAEGLIQCNSIPEKYSKITTVFIHRADVYLTKSMEKFIETITSFNNQREDSVSKSVLFKLVSSNSI
ncbi:LysR family transcriptional regulator [Metabacillus niabensis]|uniref:LysR family transcriptional regulator n=1 Tax=Metabacillus niabensis TaxID=324854 RepID=UPI001CF98930|nr:LysR family transcriptional regulator [Metabacillus niabensis]